MQDRMKIYRLVPAIAENEPNGRNAMAPGEIVVRAKTAVDARAVASDADIDFSGIDATHARRNLAELARAFRSETSYNVIEDRSGRYVPNGPRCVIEGGVRLDRPVSTQL
jgi:hypothetical protein